MDEHRRILEFAARGSLPESLSESSEFPIQVVRELVEAGYLTAIDATSFDGMEYLNPRITMGGREYLRTLQARDPLDSDVTLARLQRMRDIMVSVSTGKGGIDQVNDEYRTLFADTDAVLTSLGIANSNPFPDLWDWYGRWRSGDLPSYNSRREHLATIFNPLLEQIRARRSGQSRVPQELAPKELTGEPVIFLSHAAADVALAEHLEETFRRDVKGYDVFRTTRLGQIPSGRPWFQHITDHLSGASKYVVLLTPASQLRPWVIFETGAAWMTRRVLIPVLGGGLQPQNVIEPLKHLQLLSLEQEGQASQMIEELGGRLANPSVFCERSIQLGRLGAQRALDDAGWQQVELEQKRYAWDGPIEELKESTPVPLPDALIPALQTRGMNPRTGIPGDLWNEFSQGYVQVWYIDQRSYKHAIVSRDKQVLLAKPT